MKSGALECKSFVCLAILLAVAIPLFFTACGEGIITPLSTDQANGAPTVASIVPDTASSAGGQTVTITGSNLASSTQTSQPSVMFGGIPASQVNVISSTQLNAVVPPHQAGKVDVEVVTGNGKSATLRGGFTYTTASLSINSISPISGPAAGGTQVTITGLNFQGGISVTFGGLAAASVTLSNSNTIVAVTPAHSAGTAAVIVTNSNGQSASLASGFTFHSVDLVWSAPSSSAAPVAGYNVYRGTASAGPFGRLNGSIPVIGTSFTDPTVQGSTVYYYEVKSVDPNGVESPPAGPVAAPIGP
jgi:hypothetical protein